MLKLIRALCGAAVVLWCGIPVLAQDSYSTEPIRIVVPCLPGVASESLARNVGPLVTAEAGQPVIEDNRPGANGCIAGQAATSRQGRRHRQGIAVY